MSDPSASSTVAATAVPQSFAPQSFAPQSSAPQFAVPSPLQPVAARSRGIGIAMRLVWEALLLVAAVVAIVVAFGKMPTVKPEAFVNQAAILALYVTAFALSLRAGTPNLAIMALGALSGLAYAQLLSDDSPLGSPVAVPVAALIAIGLAALVGLILAVLTGLLSVPAWAASLAAVGALQAVILGVNDNGAAMRPVDPDGILRSSWLGYAVLAVVLLGSVVAGLVWAMPGVRRTLGANRFTGDPVRFTGARFVSALVGLLGSAILAGAAGVLATARIGAATGIIDFGTLTVVLAAALLGGVSAYGARGGFAGTALAVLLFAAVQLILNLEGQPYWVLLSIAAGAALVGLVVGRVLEILEGPLTTTSPALAGYAPAPVQYPAVPFAHMPPAPTSPPAPPAAPPVAPPAAEVPAATAATADTATTDAAAADAAAADATAGTDAEVDKSGADKPDADKPDNARPAS